jgi:spore maturation protein CgeB
VFILTLRILFVGETWKGSSARSLCEALTKIPGLTVDEIGEDQYIPRYRSLCLRVLNRLIKPLRILELRREIFTKIAALPPDILIVYKGGGVTAEMVRSVKAMGIFTANIFPDCSPHAHGERLRKAIGEYDLVISTKPFHPPLWQSVYGYSNPCVFVPHGYDSSVHLMTVPPKAFQYDLGLIATWRPEYHALMRHIADLLKQDHVRVAIAGYGWAERASEFPNEWVFAGEIRGAGYARWAQRSKILIAPVNRDVVINGQRQPGDEDTTRTYELAASHCFFIHRKTDYIQTVYDEDTEVPFFDSAEDLVKLVRHYMAEDELRFKMAAAAHTRAVPAYSIDSRAVQVATLIRMHAGL